MRLAQNALITLIAVFCSAFLVFSQDQAQNSSGKTQTVVSEGVGQTAEAAIKDAFRNAVRQVVGAVVDAETQIKNDELISDKVLTYSDGFIKRYEELGGSKNESGGLHRIRIKAEVEKSVLLEKLKSSNVYTKPVDGKGLFAETVSKLDAEKEAKAIVLKQFEGFPQSCITATVVGEPSVVEKDDVSATVEIIVQIEANLDSYKEFSKKLRATLDKMTKTKGDFTMHFQYIGFVNEFNTSPLPIKQRSKGDWFSIVQSQNKAMLWFPKYVDRNTGRIPDGNLLFAVGTPKSKPRERLDFAFYHLPNVLVATLNELSEIKGEIEVKLLNDEDMRITSEQLEFTEPFLTPFSRGDVNHLFLLCPTFFGSKAHSPQHTPALLVPYRFKLSLDELKSLKDIKVEVRF